MPLSAPRGFFASLRRAAGPENPLHPSALPHRPAHELSTVISLHTLQPQCKWILHHI